MSAPDQEPVGDPPVLPASLGKREFIVDIAARNLDRDPGDPIPLSTSPFIDTDESLGPLASDDDIFAPSEQQMTDSPGKSGQKLTTDDSDNESSSGDLNIFPFDGTGGAHTSDPKPKRPALVKAESLAARRARADRERATAFPEHCVSLNRQVAWFDDDSVTPRPVPMHGLAADFSLAPIRDADGEPVPSKARSSVLHAAKYPFNNIWASLLCHIGIYEIEGQHSDRYLCWLLRTTAKQDSLWRSVQSDGFLLSFWAIRHSQLAASAQPVYVEKLNGGPFGSYAGALASDKRRIPSLFIQMYGLRNAVPCESCERSYRRSVNPGVTPGSADQKPVRVMTPFFECISLPGFSHGVCGNCVYQVNGANCSFHYRPPSGAPAPWIATKHASREVEDRLPARRLSLTATPIKGPELGAPLLRQKTLSAKGRHWMGNQATFGRTIDWEGGVPTSSTGATDQTPGSFNLTPKASPVNNKGAKTKPTKVTPTEAPTGAPTNIAKDKDMSEVTSTGKDSGAFKVSAVGATATPSGTADRDLVKVPGGGVDASTSEDVVESH
jgi:hypothetical protein